MTVLLYETLWTNPSDGWAIAARAYARAMKMAGLKVHLHSWTAETEPLDPKIAEEIGDMQAPVPDGYWNCFVYSTPLSGAMRAVPMLRALLGYARPRVLYTTFEREQVEPSIIELMNGLDGVWVPCSWNAEVLVHAGVKEELILVAPHCYFDDDPLLGLPPPDTEERAVRSYYWIGRWEPRKAPHNLVRAFLRAFEPGDPVELTLKLSPLSWPGGDRYPGPEEVIKRELAQNPSTAWTLDRAQRAITVVRGRISREALVALHARGEVYVSASRGEGWDLPSWEAKLAGRRIITTDSGGPRDFIQKNDVLIPRTGSVLADPYYRWGAGATYADYDLDALVRALRASMQTTGRGSEWKVETLHPFRAETVGCRLKNWIENLAAKHPTEKPPQQRSSSFSEWIVKGS